jgi:hypothetical protein
MRGRLFPNNRSDKAPRPGDRVRILMNPPGGCGTIVDAGWAYMDVLLDVTNSVMELYFNELEIVPPRVRE